MDSVTVEFSRHRTDPALVLLALTVLLGEPRQVATRTRGILHSWPEFPVPGSPPLAEYTLITAGVTAGDCSVRVYDSRLLPAVQSWQNNLPERRVQR